MKIHKDELIIVLSCIALGIIVGMLLGANMQLDYTQNELIGFAQNSTFFVIYDDTYIIQKVNVTGIFPLQHLP